MNSTAADFTVTKDAFQIKWTFKRDRSPSEEFTMPYNDPHSLAMEVAAR